MIWIIVSIINAAIVIGFSSFLVYKEINDFKDMYDRIYHS